MIFAMDEGRQQRLMMVAVPCANQLFPARRGTEVSSFLQRREWLSVYLGRGLQTGLLLKIGQKV